jgi:hypothetical protein
MTADEIRAGLAALGPLDFQGAENLAQRASKDARAPLFAFGQQLGWEGNPDAGKAGTVLTMLAELSIVPRLAIAQKLAGPRKLPMLLEAYRAYEALQQSTMEKLQRALRDSRPIPENVSGAVERPLPPRRMCDEAYMLRWRLTHPDEPEEDFRQRETRWLRWEPARRDEAIATLLRTGEWPPL